MDYQSMDDVSHCFDLRLSYLCAINSVAIAENFVLGLEEMEWVEDYIEDKNWDEE